MKPEGMKKRWSVPFSERPRRNALSYSDPSRVRSGYERFCLRYLQHRRFELFQYLPLADAAASIITIRLGSIPFWRRQDCQGFEILGEG